MKYKFYLIFFSENQILQNTFEFIFLNLISMYMAIWSYTISLYLHISMYYMIKVLSYPYKIR